MTGPRNTAAAPQPAGPVADAVADITDGSVAAGGVEVGPPMSFEYIAGLSDDELQALADKYGVDTSTGLPKGVLVQEIHNRLTGVTAPDEPVTLVPVPVDPAGTIAGTEPPLPETIEDTGDPLADSVVTVETARRGDVA